MSASTSQPHAVSKKATSVATNSEKVAQFDMSSIDKSSPSLLQQALAYGLESGSKCVCVGNQSDWHLISFNRPEASVNEAFYDNTSDHLQISVIKNRENLLPALIGFLGDAQQTETAQVTSAPSKL
ncbi:hypothetical protein CKAH01_17799 [Colletotrichum kahawae]|uniref:Uncharacterized protein n=1 Tax=Colletotrichum kahawae TaxID=34407 RepID=A0AAD9YAK8_COLKA|nr:hypothetical protein CKAH01_17799 [Colletotrichum kahawae]